jgi:hypothetical protein
LRDADAALAIESDRLIRSDVHGGSSEVERGGEDRCLETQVKRQDQEWKEGAVHE